MTTIPTPTHWVRIELSEITDPAPRLHDGPTTPCACGGTLVWVVTYREYRHVHNLCNPCSADGYVMCPQDCHHVLAPCQRPRPVECTACGSDLTVEGCEMCEVVPEEIDPDSVLDALRERDW